MTAAVDEPPSGRMQAWRNNARPAQPCGNAIATRYFVNVSLADPLPMRYRGTARHRGLNPTHGSLNHDLALYSADTSVGHTARR